MLGSYKALTNTFYFYFIFFKSQLQSQELRKEKQDENIDLKWKKHVYSETWEERF